MLSGLVAALGLAGCGRPSARDIVVVTLDTVRADHLGCYGSRRGTTPALDALAGSGVVFDDASCTVPLTLPSHASLFTGRYPTATGVRNNGAFVLPERESTLAEQLEEAGFATGAVIAAYPLQRRYGLAQGFGIYDESLKRRTRIAGDAFAVHFDERDARSVTDRALDVWARLAGRPRFLWVHYFDAHAPYAAPEPWGSAHAGDPYAGEIAYVDAEAGRLLKQIAVDAPNAIVVVAADHGEGLGEHGEKTHGVFLYQSTVRVPLIIRAPGLWPAGKRVPDPVSLVDVVPTLLALSKLPVPTGLDGTDLAPAVFGAPIKRREIYAESYLPLLQFRFSALTMLRDGALKYIDAPTVEIYDLARDPGELDDLAGRSPRATELAARLQAVVESADPDAGLRAVGAFDAEADARLRSLGYVPAGVSLASPHHRGRDPKTMADYLRHYDRAVGLQASGDIDAGLAELTALIPEAPENYMVRYQIAAGHLARGRAEDARRELQQVVAAAPDFGGAYFMLGDCFVALGRIDDAVAAFAAAAERMPAQAAPWLAQGRVLERVGQFERAGAAYRAAVTHEPSSGEPARMILALYAGRGDLPRAVRELDELASQFPQSAGLQTALAEARYRAGDKEGSTKALRAALGLDPARIDARLLEAGMLLDADRPEDAASVYRGVLADEPEARLASFGLGRALVLTSVGADTEAFIAELTSRYPQDAAPRVLRGVLFERRGERASALAAYREALAIDPRDADATRGMSRIEAMGARQ